jgi:UDP-2-acetamido-3-amino-2,3-dideoxy-glucuronate N-acetyltransferase
MIGAGAVITKHVKPFSIMIGNPARHSGWISAYGHKLSFNQTGRAECPGSKKIYVLRLGQVSEME